MTASIVILQLAVLAVDPTTVLNFVPYPGIPSKDADLHVKQSVFPGCFANGLPGSEGAALRSRPDTLGEDGGPPT